VKIGFTGTQDGMTVRQKSTFTGVVQAYAGTPLEFHHGMCVGADEEAHIIVRTLLGRDATIVGHPPVDQSRANMDLDCDQLWRTTSFLTRNADIVYCTRLLIATPRQNHEVLRSGTWATIRKARQVGRDYVIIFPDGAPDWTS